MSSIITIFILIRHRSLTAARSRDQDEEVARKDDEIRRLSALLEEAKKENAKLASLRTTQDQFASAVCLIVGFIASIHVVCRTCVQWLSERLD